MHIILDNLSAQIVAGGIFLMLVSVQMSGRRAMNEASGYYALRKQEISFVETLQRDLRNVTTFTSVSEDPTTGVFSFRSLTTPGSSVDHAVEYRREAADALFGTTCYRIGRYVDGQPAGGSMSTLTSWTIVARNAEGGTITDVSDAKQVFVRFEAINPYADEGVLDAAAWQATLFPPALQNGGSL